jgi:hypothetical protein
MTFVTKIRLLGESIDPIFPDTKEGDEAAKRLAEHLLHEKIDIGLTLSLDKWIQTYSDECWDLDVPELFPMRLKIYHDFDHDYYDKNPTPLKTAGSEGIHYVKYVQVNGWRVKAFPVTPQGISEAKAFAAAQFRAVLEQAREDFVLFYPFQDKSYRVGLQ